MNIERTKLIEECDLLLTIGDLDVSEKWLAFIIQNDHLSFHRRCFVLRTRFRSNSASNRYVSALILKAISVLRDNDALYTKHHTIYAGFVSLMTLYSFMDLPKVLSFINKISSMNENLLKKIQLEYLCQLRFTSIGELNSL